MFLEPEKNIEQFQVDPGMTVADLGAGTGFYASLMAKKVGPSGKVYALDVQKDLLSKLKKESIEQNLVNIETIWADLDEMRGTTLRDNSVDRVLMANILFQLEKKEVGLEEAFRILKPGGKFLLIDWSDSYGGLGPKPNDVIKPDAGRTLAEHVGFEFIREVDAGDHHYGLLFNKKAL